MNAGQVITEVVRVHLEGFDKASTRAVGEDNLIIPLLEIENLAIMEEEKTF